MDGFGKKIQKSYFSGKKNLVFHSLHADFCDLHIIGIPRWVHSFGDLS